MHRYFSSVGTCGLVAAGMACVMGLVSCKDKEADKPEVNPVDEAAVAKAAAADRQKELLDYMIFRVGKLAGSEVGNPVWQEEVRDMRNMLEEYYNSLDESGADPKTCLKLGLMLADITSSMRVYEKAMKYYNDTLAKWEALPEADRRSVEGRRLRSSLANGMGSCFLAQGKATEALPHYEKALEIDEEVFHELAPEDLLPEGSVTIDPDLERAAEDVLSSYRCLGECQKAAEDPEEARDTYKKGQELAMRMNHLRPGASLQLIRLFSAQGDLENDCAKNREAAVAWSKAYELSKKLLEVAPQPSVRYKIVMNARNLEKSLKAISPKLREEMEAARAAEAEDGVAPDEGEAPQE